MATRDFGSGSTIGNKYNTGGDRPRTGNEAFRKWLPLLLVALGLLFFGLLRNRDRSREVKDDSGRQMQRELPRERVNPSDIPRPDVPR